MSITNIIGHGPGEEEWCLRYDAQVLMIFLQIKCADIVTINQNLTTLELVEACDQFSQTRLARACVSHKGYCLSSFDVQIEISQHRLPIIVAEENMLELDLAPQIWYRLLIDLMDT